MKEAVYHSNDRPRVLFVDDELSVLKSLKRFSHRRAWTAFTASSAEEALETIIDNSFDVVVSDMRMPGMHGDEFLEKVKTISPNTVRILLTGYSDMQAMESVINNAKVYNYITKPWDEADFDKTINDALSHYQTLCKNEDTLDQSINQNKKLSKLALLLDKQVKERSMEVDQALGLLNGLSRQVRERSIEVDQALGLLDGLSKKAEQNFRESLDVLTLVLEWKEGKDSGHIEFVSNYGVKTAEKLGLSQNDIDSTRLAGNLHRIGMLCLPDEIQRRAVFSFSTEERRLYQNYPCWGEEALSSSQSLVEIGKIIRHQREYVNGTGFPDKLCDKEIPIASKILLALSDFYDAYNGRLERSISGSEDAKEYINSWAGKRYDVEVVNALWEVLGDFGAHDKRKLNVDSNQLKTGMKVLYDIVSHSGSVLLTSGTELSEATIIKLLEYEEKYSEKLDIAVELPDDCKR